MAAESQAICHSSFDSARSLEIAAKSQEPRYIHWRMTSNHGPAPPQSVIEAFGISGVVTPLPGGQGECFLLTLSDSRKIVLKPTPDPVESEVLCALQNSLAALHSTKYRVAKPVPLSTPIGFEPSSPSTSSHTKPQYLHFTAPDTSSPNPHIYWTATHFLTGHGSPAVRPQELLTASRALHADLLTLYTSPAPIIATKTHRWAWGDRYAWSELPLSAIPNVDPPTLERVQPYLDRLWSLVHLSLADLAHDPDPAVSRVQVIHGDLSGNLLFDDEHPGTPPAIIDFSLYHRPVAYAEAIVAADLLLWKKGDIGMLGELRLLDGEGRVQILVRAVIFRVVTFAIEVDEGFVERNLALMDLEGAVGGLEGVVGVGGGRRGWGLGVAL